MCRILGIFDKGNMVPDIDSWPIIPIFDPQAALRRLWKVDSWHPKPHSKHLTLTAWLILFFV